MKNFGSFARSHWLKHICCRFPALSLDNHAPWHLSSFDTPSVVNLFISHEQVSGFVQRIEDGEQCLDGNYS